MIESKLALPIETKRLYLRDRRIEDLEETFAYANDERFYRHLTMEIPTVENIKKFLEICIEKQNAEPRTDYELAIELKESGALIGGIAIRRDSISNDSGNVGYALSPEYWGQGIMTEALIKILELSFDTLNLYRIWATADPENIASIRVMEKVGMQKEGLMRSNILIRGKRRDSYLYAILRNEFIK